MVLLVRRKRSDAEDAAEDAGIDVAAGGQGRLERRAGRRNDLEERGPRSGGDLRGGNRRKLRQDAGGDGEAAGARGGGADELGGVDDDVDARAARRAGIANDLDGVAGVPTGPCERQAVRADDSRGQTASDGERSSEVDARVEDTDVAAAGAGQ